MTAERDRDKDYYYKEYRRESGDERMAKVRKKLEEKYWKGRPNYLVVSQR